MNMKQAEILILEIREMGVRQQGLGEDHSRQLQAPSESGGRMAQDEHGPGTTERSSTTGVIATSATPAR
jgi:hypothetical protein